MAYFNLRETGGTNIHTDFRFELEIESGADGRLGLNNKLTAFITSCDLPAAPGTAIPWYMPGGMKNHQAGKRETKEISLTFVICSDQTQSWYTALEKWGTAVYDLNTGNNYGKAGYSVDGINILVKGEDGKVRYKFHLLRSFITDINYGNLNSEGNELLKVSCNIVYDLYEVYADGVLLTTTSNL